MSKADRTRLPRLHTHAARPAPETGAGLLCGQPNSIAGSYTLKEEPQPQVLFTWGLSNLKPAASSVST